MPDSSVDQVRQALDAIDDEIIRLAARRTALASAIGAAKIEAGLPTRDFEREKEVIERARRKASRLALAPAVAEKLMETLIRTALAVQEKDRIVARAEGAGRRALVIGGAGKMGRWFVRFLSSQGFSVEVADPSGPVPGHAHRGDWAAGPLDQDLIVLATTLGVTAEILSRLAARKPPGLVFDVGSLKTPIRQGLQALVRAGVRVTSVHPMFGPDEDLLSGRHVIFIDLGVPEATRQARGLFAETMARQVEMAVDEHDRLIAYVLGLSHALNICFFTALANSGEAAPRLARMSSTTFDAQLEVAARVAGENPYLYYEIQALNDYGSEALATLADAVDHLREAVASGDPVAFAELMTAGKTYLGFKGSADGEVGKP